MEFSIKTKLIKILFGANLVVKNKCKRDRKLYIDCRDNGNETYWNIP